MGFPQAQIVGSDGVVIGVSGQVTNPPFLGAFALGNASNASVAATTAFVSLKAGAGRYFGMTANASGNGTIVVSDGSGGTIIGGAASTATSNGVPIVVPSLSGGVVFTSGLVVLSTASSPVVVVHFS